MGIFDKFMNIFRRKKETPASTGLNKSPLYGKICVLAGYTEPIDPDQLSNKLIEKDQVDVKKWAYANGWDKTALYPVADFVEVNYKQINSEMPAVLKKLSVSLWLFYIHAAQAAIQLQDKNTAKRFVNAGIKYFQLAGESFVVNPGFLLMLNYLNNNLKEFEKLARKAIGTGWGWDGKNGYEREIMYGMHQILKGRPAAEVAEEIMIKGTKKFITLQIK